MFNRFEKCIRLFKGEKMRIYIAGPYAAKNCTLHDATRIAQQNVDKAIKVFHELKAEGHKPFVPHLSHYIHLAGDKDYADWWYKYDLTFLDHWAEAIFMMKGWKESKGATLELKRARELMLLVIFEDMNERD